MNVDGVHKVEHHCNKWKHRGGCLQVIEGHTSTMAEGGYSNKGTHI